MTQKNFHTVTVIATVSYELKIEANTAKAAEKKALDIWRGNNGFTYEDWEDYFGTGWDDVINLETMTA